MKIKTRANLVLVRRDAEMLMKTAEAIRSYTVEHVQSVTVDGEGPDAPFHKEAGPEFAAGTTLAYQSMVGYSYREVAINSTNPKNLASGWSRGSSMTFGSRVRLPFHPA